MAKYVAKWMDQVIASANVQDTINIEGNVYFPGDSVNKDFLTSSTTPYTCPWKGECTYYNVKVGEEINPDSAWTYLNPKPTAITIVGKDFSGFVAFYKGVVVSQED